MKLYRILYPLIVLTFTATVAFAANDDLKFEHFTNEDGLPSSYVKCIAQDQFGFIWLATRSSVCRFDGKIFKTFQAYGDDGQAFDIWCKKFIVSNDSVLIAQTTEDQYYFFDFALEYFKPFTQINNLGIVLDLEASKDGYWIYGDEGVYFYDEVNNESLSFKDKIDFANFGDDAKVVMVREKGQHLVAYTDINELLIFDVDKKQQRQFNLPEELTPSEEPMLYLDNHNYAWIGVTDNGVYRINLTNGNCIHFLASNNNKYRLLHNMVHTIDEDQQGRVWIGTENGLCLWSPYTEQFSYYQYDINNTQGLNTNPIYDIFCDREGNMWLGTYFGGINLWGNNNNFFNIWQAGTSDYHIGGSAVSCITEDDKGNIWIGMEDMGVNKIDARTGKISKFVSTGDNKGLSFNNVHSLLFENSEKLWIATYTGGINILNLKTKTFEYINTQNHKELPSNNIYYLLKSGNIIYISTSNGIATYDLTTKTLSGFQPEVFNEVQVEYMYVEKEKIWVSTEIGVYSWDKGNSTFEKSDKFIRQKNVNFVKGDSKNRVWVGDNRYGLCCYDQANDMVYYYNESNGFPFSWVLGMEEGEGNTLWFSGDKGLVKFTPESNESVLYNRDSDIPFEQFNFRASFKDSKGNIYFGGNNGMISFNESVKYQKPDNKNVVFRGMQLFNQPLIPGKSSPLKQSLNLHHEVRLKYKQNVFTIEYTGLNFQNRGKCKYAYYLENFERNWNYVGTRDFASYTNLSPGEYFFHVKTVGEDGNDNNLAQNSLKIIVEPPFWLSNWGFFIYFVLVVIILVGLYLVTTKIQKSKALVEIERRERAYASDLNNFKLEFFTNISHELRTPLTLIVGPLVRILQEEKLSPGLSHKMKGIKNNAYRLLTLINQLLEFRKIESGKEKLKVSPHNFSDLLNTIEDSFEEAAEAKGINLFFDKPVINEKIWIDYQKMEYIVVNLLSNALKYTDKGGSVKLELLLSNNKGSEKQLTIRVTDTGKGIEQSKINKIFDRFYQDNSNESQSIGSGIGLAFVNSLVQLHRGTIKVSSEVGVGSVFTVNIPVSREDYEDNEIVLANSQFVDNIRKMEHIKAVPTLHDEVPLLSKNPIVLVVDDNQELLDFISEILKGEFKIVTATDGDAGFGKIHECMPDLIISDVMMPGINGFELTKKIKSDIKTSHIPVILLTAKSGEENEFEGLQTGADYYIEKPFFPHVLNKIVENILTTRKNLIEKFRSDMTMLPTDMAYSESDKELIERITFLIKNNIDKPNLDVTFLVNEIGISRSLLHVKLKKLTDCSATEFIRSIRLREAVKLIAEGKCNISEAAYRTGFSSPAYFSRRFKEYFGVTPKAYFDN